MGGRHQRRQFIDFLAAPGSRQGDLRGGAKGRGMRYCWLILLCLLWMPAGADSPALRAEITHALQTGVDTWNAGDLDKFMAGYVHSDELTFTAGGRVVRGYDALQKRYQTTYGNSKESMGQLRFENIEAWELGPNHALALGEWILLLPGKGVGEQVRGVFSLVLTRASGGGWLILHDHTSRLDKEKEAPKSRP